MTKREKPATKRQKPTVRQLCDRHYRFLRALAKEAAREAREKKSAWN